MFFDAEVRQWLGQSQNRKRLGWVDLDGVTWKSLEEVPMGEECSEGIGSRSYEMQHLMSTYCVPGCLLYINLVNCHSIPVKKVALLAALADGDGEAQRY